MSRRNVLLTALAAAALIAGLIAAYAAGRHLGPPPTSPTGTAAPAPQPAAPTPPPRPDYEIINNLGRPLVDDDYRRLDVITRYIRLVNARDYALPYPGYPVDQIDRLAVGQAAQTAHALKPPARADYDEAARSGYRKTVTMVHAALNSDDTVVVFYRTYDTLTMSTEASYTTTTAPCPTGTCIATYTLLDTE